MELTKKAKQRIMGILLIFILTLTMVGGAIQPNISNTGNTNAVYLSEMFSIAPLSGIINSSTFNAALTKVTGNEVKGISGNVTILSAVEAAVAAADYEEFKLTYDITKTAKRLAAYGMKSTAPANLQAALVSALDSSMITIKEGRIAALNGILTAEQANSLLMAVANAKGNGRNFIGYSNDPTVAGKLNNMWNSFLIFDYSKLSKIGNTAVEKKLTTGYNLKMDSYDARFLPELTIQYGHSDIKHAQQLLALLNSEKISAKVQLEPKISVYEYLLEWGPIPEPSPTYEVKKISDDFYLAYAVEYDLLLEFRTVEAMQSFDKVVEKFAKKYEGNDLGKGLLYASWWQPLYSTTTPMSNTSYKEIYDCVIRDNGYSIHPFALPVNLNTVATELGKLDSSIKVEAVKRYCNNAFYRYLTGESFQ